MFEVFANDYRITIQEIPLGNQGEDMARCLVIDITDAVLEFGSGGTVSVRNKRHGDELPYFCTNVSTVTGADSEGNVHTYIKWTLTDVDTAVSGSGFVQADYIISGVTVKTWVYKYFILPSLGITGDVPDPYEDILEEIEAQVSAVQAAAASAAASAAQASAEATRIITTTESVVEDWLSDHIVTGYTVDDTLTISGAAADSKKAGDMIRAAFVTEQASGSIASFTDGADGVPLKDLVVNISPVQSGTGDPSPSNVRAISGWTGANIYNDSEYGGLIKWNQICGGYNNQTTAGVSYTNNQNGTFTINGTATGNSNVSVASTINAEAGHVYLGYLNGGATLPGQARLTMGGLQFGAPLGGLYKNTPNYARLGFRIDFKTGDAFNNLTFIPQWYDLTLMFGEEVADYVYGLEQNHVGKGVEWFKNIFYKDYYVFDNRNLVTTASAVNGDPYNSYNISFSSAGTVYGGTLDVTTGMLTVTHGMVDLSNVTVWTDDTVNYRYISNNSALSGAVSISSLSTVANIISEQKKVWAVRYMMNNAGSVDGIGQYDTAIYWYYLDGAKAAPTGKVVYPLAQPVSYQLTPTEVKTLLGINNIWADTGDITNLEYRADTKLYIERLTNPGNDMIADSNIASGQYFMVGNSLYLATSAIASGATITPGTNCTATNLAAALNAINS